MGAYERKTANDILSFGAGSFLQVEPGAAAPGLIRSVAQSPSGFMLAQGEIVLDGSNPTPVTTGLTSIVSASVVLKRATTPGDDPVAFTVDYGGIVAAGQLNLYAWKTDGSDPTLIASTNSTAVVSWTCVGT